jgi:hypothetical protein
MKGVCVASLPALIPGSLIQQIVALRTPSITDLVHMTKDLTFKALHSIEHLSKIETLLIINYSIMLKLEEKGCIYMVQSISFF